MQNEVSFPLLFDIRQPRDIISLGSQSGPVKASAIIPGLFQQTKVKYKDDLKIITQNRIRRLGGCRRRRREQL